MTINKKTFNSVAGFSVDETTVINELRDIKNINTLEIQNRNFSDSKKINYILKGTDTSILSLSSSSEQIFVSNDTVNFITSHVVASNESTSGNYIIKIESCVVCNSVGDVQVLSSLKTIIKDSVPSGQSWSIEPYDQGDVNRFSYSTTKAGGVSVVKWIASVEVISVLV
jgi:hypothetical protein